MARNCPGGLRAPLSPRKTGRSLAGDNAAVGGHNTPSLDQEEMSEYHKNAGKQEEAEEKSRCATKGARKGDAPSAKRAKHLTTFDKLAVSVEGRFSKIESALEKMAEIQLANMSATKPAQEAQEENAPASYVHSLQALENAGLKRVMAADLPNDRQLTYARGMMEKIK